MDDGDPAGGDLVDRVPPPIQDEISALLQRATGGIRLRPSDAGPIAKVGEDEGERSVAA